MNMTNAASMVYDLGISDISGQQIATQSRPAPQHLPKFFTFAEKGTTKEMLLVGVERENIYGSKTFEHGSAYFTHATLFANAVNAEGNACIYKRIVPEDAGPRANLTLWLDVLKATVDLYERNIDGSIKTDSLGDPIISGTAPGYIAKWVVTSRDTEGTEELGGFTVQTGDQLDVQTGAVSERFPIFDFVVDSKGSYGNSLGVRFWTPNAKTEDIPYRLMEETKSFPYNMAFVKRDTPTSSAEFIRTIFNETSITVSLQPGVKDPVTGQNLFIGSRAIASYSSETDPSLPYESPPFGGFHIYQDNLNTLLKLFHEAEIPFIDQWSDFTSNPEDFGLFNPITGQSTYAVPYHSFIFSDMSDSITFSKFTDVGAAGGSDGTMTQESFDAAVAKEMLRYRDRKDPVMDLAYHIESIFYDSGFSSETKFVLPSFISQRHDTFLVLGTHVFGQPALTESQEHSMAISLRTRIMNYPESDYFGTPATRAMIMGCSGVIRNTEYRVPATYEIAIKFAKYMGASNGRWKGSARPDGNPGNVIQSLVDLNMVFVPESIRYRFWAVGLNWIQRYDTETLFIPAYRTIYPDDTSVLTSAINVMGICTVNKKGHKCWRTFSGVSGLTNLQLCQRVNNFIRTEVKGIFDDRFAIEPRAVVTDLDLARNFSWTLPIGFGAPGMKTVQTMYTEADRIERMRTEE